METGLCGCVEDLSGDGRYSWLQHLPVLVHTIDRLSCCFRKAAAAHALAVEAVALRPEAPGIENENGIGACFGGV